MRYAAISLAIMSVAFFAMYVSTLIFLARHKKARIGLGAHLLGVTVGMIVLSVLIVIFIEFGFVGSDAAT